MPPIDVERLRLRAPVPATAPKLVHRVASRYIKGPLPLHWVERAARLPGKSLHVGMAVWYSVGLTRSRSVSLSNVSGSAFGVDRNSKYRALAWLEQAGLISVSRKLGRAPVVTIIDACEASPSKPG